MTPRLPRLALCAGLLAATASAAEPAGYRDVMLATLELRDEAALAAGRELPSTRAPLQREWLLADAGLWAALATGLPAPDALLQRVQRARDRLLRDAATPRAVPVRSKQIQFPEPEPISQCTDASASAAHGMFEAWAASSEILAAAKWPCLQTDLGENAAEGCSALAIETEAAESEYELESFCLGAQRDATIGALADTQQNIADFLNERLDTTVSSRATQASVEALQQTLDTLLLDLADLRGTVAEDDAGIAAGLADLLDDATVLTARLSALASRIHDARFRMQVVQVDVEDVQRRLADVQAEAVRLTAAGEALRDHLRTIGTALDAAHARLQAAQQEQRDRRLAAALGDARVNVLRYRLPAAQGGELERSRELLIRALGAYEALGADVAAARALLATGDTAYNQGRALDAYDAFARAYRLLMDTQTTATVKIMGDSFE